VVIKTLGERLKGVKGAAGATIMGDGRVGLILDINGIFEIYESKNFDGLVKSQHHPSTVRQAHGSG
jgi:chemotaxis protein histidine kinase CheA